MNIIYHCFHSVGKSKNYNDYKPVKNFISENVFRNCVDVIKNIAGCPSEYLRVRLEPVLSQNCSLSFLWKGLHTKITNVEINKRLSILFYVMVSNGKEAAYEKYIIWLCISKSNEWVYFIRFKNLQFWIQFSFKSINSANIPV